MEDNKKEKEIKTSLEPVSLKGTEKILDQMKNCVCRILNNEKGTGFFTKIPYKSKLLPVLITNNHVLGQNDIENKKTITLYLNNDNQKVKKIKMDENRLIYTNEKLDITIIEIKENEDELNNKYLELDDKIINFLKENEENKEPGNMNEIYSSESIYVINYPGDADVVVSYGQSPKLNESEIKHKCCTKPGSSGSPILLINNQKLIGIHYAGSEDYEFNKGTLIIYAIIEFQKIKNNLLIINKEGKYINNNEINEINNYIIAEFDIQEDDKEIRIINSYEQSNREQEFKVYNKEYENEKEIKENCEIIINNDIIPFFYFYKFNKKGKYNIKYIFKNNITKLDYMFNGCSSLTNIDLSNFNTNNVTDMSFMFNGCSSLTNINLSNFNTNNVTNMHGMFYECSSLTNIDLSNFNTNNVTDMSFIFHGCSSLTNINLSNFNTNKVINMSNMFGSCSSLTNIDLSNFNTNNVTTMYCMFMRCSSLTNINLSNFNTNKVINMSNMFNGCSSLTNIDLSNFNTNNVTDMSDMFNGCSSLAIIDLSNFNTNNVTDMRCMFMKCSCLINIDLSNFNFNNVTDMRCMFMGCSSLTTIDLSNFNDNLVTNMHGMFCKCNNLIKDQVIVKDERILNQFKYI